MDSGQKRRGFRNDELICPSCQSVAENFACDVGQITSILSRILCPPRGAFRDRHERWARDAMAVTSALDEWRESGRRSRVVLTSRRRCQAPKMPTLLRDDGDNKARSPGRARNKP